MEMIKLTQARDGGSRCQRRYGNAPYDLLARRYPRGSDRAHGDDLSYARRVRRRYLPCAERSNELHGDCLRTFLEFRCEHYWMRKHLIGFIASSMIATWRLEFNDPVSRAKLITTLADLWLALTINLTRPARTLRQNN